MTTYGYLDAIADERRKRGAWGLLRAVVVDLAVLFLLAFALLALTVGGYGAVGQ